MKYRRNLVLGLVGACALGATGCRCIDEPYVRAVKAYADVQVEEYISYVEADDSLSDAEKIDRVQASESLQRAADEAYTSVVGGGDS